MVKAMRKSRVRDDSGKYVIERGEYKHPRNTRLTDTAWKGLQLLADHHNDCSRAEYLERLVREECDRLCISLESSEEAA